MKRSTWALLTMAVLAAASAATEANPLATTTLGNGASSIDRQGSDTSAIISRFVAVPEASSTRPTPLAALRATLARGGIRLDVRGDGVFAATAGCTDVADRLQPYGCYRCILAGDLDATSEVLEKITAIIDRYPTELLAQADVHTLSLCRRLDNVNPRGTMAGISDMETRRVMVEVSRPAFLPDIIHHELFHMIESARIAHVSAHDPEWERANPTGFSYSKAGSTTEARPTGFVRRYAASHVVEDRASTYEYMLADAFALCTMAAKDPLLHAKVKIIWSRMKTYPGGQQLMDGVAACVRRLAER